MIKLIKISVALIVWIVLILIVGINKEQNMNILTKIELGIVILIVVGITLIVGSINEWYRDIKRIKELENRLEQYYKEREKRLKDKNML